VRTLLINATAISPIESSLLAQVHRRASGDRGQFVKASMQGWQSYLADPSVADAEISGSIQI